MCELSTCFLDFFLCCDFTAVEVKLGNFFVNYRVVFDKVWTSKCRLPVFSDIIPTVHCKRCFSAPSSKLCQNWIRH